MVCCYCGEELVVLRGAAGGGMGPLLGCPHCDGVFQKVDGPISGTPEGVSLKEMLKISFRDYSAQQESPLG